MRCYLQSRQSKSDEACKKRVRQTASSQMQPPRTSDLSNSNGTAPPSCKSNRNDALTMRQKAIMKRPTSCKCNYNKTLASTIAKKQKCHCNRPCKLHEQLWWLWSAATTATSQKKSSFEPNLTINHLLAIVASTRQVNMSVLTWVIKNLAHFLSLIACCGIPPRKVWCNILLIIVPYWTIRLLNYWQFSRF